VSTWSVPAAELFSESGVQIVPEHVAHEIERQDGEDDEGPRKEQDTRGSGDVDAALADHVAPAWDLRRDAHTQEVQGGDLQQGEREGECGLHDEGRHQVGEDVAQEDARVAGPDRADGLDEDFLFELQGEAEDDAGRAREEINPDGDDDIGETGAQDGEEGQSQQQGGKGHHHVYQPHGHEAKLPVISGQHPDRDSEGDGVEDDPHAADEGQASAVDDAAEEVAAEMVRPEPVGSAGALQALGGVQPHGIMGGDERGEERQHQDQADHARPRQGDFPFD